MANIMILMPSHVFCEIENCIVYLFSCNVYHCPTNPCISIFIYFEIPFALWITFTAQSPGLENSFFGKFHKFGECYFLSYPMKKIIPGATFIT